MSVFENAHKFLLKISDISKPKPLNTTIILNKE